MTTTNNTSFLGVISMPEDKADAKTMIDVKNVTMIFNIASEQLNSLKEYAIALSRRELRFKEFRALDDVSFEVKQGDVFGILGTNGSGKSTMLKIIAGVLEPSKGSCTVNGNIAPLIELGAGFDLELTARENIFLNGALLGYSNRFIKEHFEEIVEFAEVRDFLDMPMKNYSSGMVARIAFAIATVIVPDILIVDEVLSVGDFMFQQKCERRIQSLIKDHGVTVLIVSHNNEQIERLCNKAVWIEKGHLRAIGGAKDVCEVYKAIGGRKGSEDSEIIILSLLSDTRSTPSSLRECVFGDDRYSTAVQANDFSAAPGDTIILTNSDAWIENRIATALAGALDASLLTLNPERVPDVTMQEIKHRSPRRVIVLGDETQVTDSVLRTIGQALPQADIRRLSGREGETLSLQAHGFGEDQGGTWGTAAIVASNAARTEATLLSSYLFSHKAPFFVLDESGSLSSKEACIISKCKTVIALADESELSDEALRALAPDAEAVRFRESCFEEASDAILPWLIEQQRENQAATFKTLVVTSPDADIDNNVVGPLAGRMNALILPENPGDLDSIAHAIDTARSRLGEVDRIVYLGNEMRFSKLNKELLAKAVLSKKDSERSSQ